jgi:hypothetical protein
MLVHFNMFAVRGPIRCGFTSPFAEGSKDRLGNLPGKPLALQISGLRPPDDFQGFFQVVSRQVREYFHGKKGRVPFRGGLGGGGGEVGKIWRTAEGWD